MENISVVIPNYNHAHFIQKTINSLMAQTMQPMEIIVVDDGSTDNSKFILERMPIKLIDLNKNCGPAFARNIGLDHAKGEIIIFIDADTYADPNMIKAIIDAYKLLPNDRLAGVCGAGIDVHIMSKYDLWRSIHAKQHFGNVLKDNIPFPFGLCMSFYKEILTRIGGFDNFYRLNAGEDYDLGIRLKKAGYWLRYTPKAKVYHQHKDNIESIKRIQYNWYYWGSLAERRNGRSRINLFGGIYKRLVTEFLFDLIILRDIELAFLDLYLHYIRLRALIDSTNSNIRDSHRNAHQHNND